MSGDADPWELSTVGLTLRSSDGQFVIEEPAGFPVIEPSLEDLANGLFAHWARSTGLRDWARIILGVLSIDLSSLEDSTNGEALLEMIWAASADEALSKADVELLRSLATRTA